jgi:hypothetical protein
MPTTPELESDVSWAVWWYPRPPNFSSVMWFYWATTERLWEKTRNLYEDRLAELRDLIVGFRDDQDSNIAEVSFNISLKSFGRSCIGLYENIRSFRDFNAQLSEGYKPVEVWAPILDTLAEEQEIVAFETKLARTGWGLRSVADSSRIRALGHVSSFRSLAKRYSDKQFDEFGCELARLHSSTGDTPNKFVRRLIEEEVKNERRTTGSVLSSDGPGEIQNTGRPSSDEGEPSRGSER